MILVVIKCNVKISFRKTLECHKVQHVNIHVLLKQFSQYMSFHSHVLTTTQCLEHTVISHNTCRSI